MPRPAAAPPEEMQARIMRAAESQLRRYGPDKLTVTDIAKESGMSHPNLYRFYSCKDAILQAVTRRWLAEAEDACRAAAAEPGTAGERMEAFLLTLHRLKLRKVTEDPETFRLYHALVRKNEGLLQAHMDALSEIGASITRDGVRDGEFPSGICGIRTAGIFRDAMVRFYHPLLVEETVEGGEAEERLRATVRLLVDGLRYRALAGKGAAECATERQEELTLT